MHGGYAVLNPGGTGPTSYPYGAQGHSFHHGRMVRNLHAHTHVAPPGVDPLEVTVTEMIKCLLDMLGVCARRDGAERPHCRRLLPQLRPEKCSAVHYGPTFRFRSRI